MNRLRALHDAGVPIWLDTLRCARDAGIDLPDVTAALERAGLRSLCDS